MTRTTKAFSLLIGALALVFTSFAGGAGAADPAAQEGVVDEDTDGNDGDTPNNVADDGDNEHPSGKDRSVENGSSNNQGNAGSDPDDDGRGPDNSNGGADKPDGPGGNDPADQDGNNGCGNDDDFEDDNEGRCLGRDGAPGQEPDEALVCPPGHAEPAGPMVDEDGDGVADNCTFIPVGAPCPDGMDEPDQGEPMDSDGDGVADNCVEVDEDEVEGPDEDADKVSICHATGSETNPFVFITISKQGVLNGHAGEDHQDGRDIIPAFDDFPGQPVGQGPVTEDDCPTAGGEEPDELECPEGFSEPEGPMVDDDGDGVADNCVEVDDGGEEPGELECPEGMVPPAGGQELTDGPDEDELADNCVEVEGEGVVNKPITPTITPNPNPNAGPAGGAPAVLGDVVTRSVAGGQLPRTGNDAAAGLAPFGLALLLAGFALQRSSVRLRRNS